MMGVTYPRGSALEQAMSRDVHKKPSRFSITDWDAHCAEKLNMRKMDGTEAMYAGDCPICKDSRCFVVNLKKREFFCLECGIKGKIQN